MQAEPFILEVTNSAPTAKRFYLGQGLLYTRGFETAGQLRTGAFPAIGEGAAAPSLYATTQSAVSIEQFIAFLQNNPTVMYQIQTTSTAPNANLRGSVTVQQQGMIKNSTIDTFPNRQGASQTAFNLQFQNSSQPKFFSYQDLATITVAPNSTLTLNLYPVESKSNFVTATAPAPGVSCLEINCIMAPCNAPCFKDGKQVNPDGSPIFPIIGGTPASLPPELRNKFAPPQKPQTRGSKSWFMENLPVIGLIAAAGMVVAWFIFKNK